MAIRFVIDSAADVIPSECEALGISHVPLTVRFDDVEYRDAVDMTHREFYERLIESDTLPSTSQATPAAFAEAFEPLVEAGHTVICLVVSSKLSGTYQSACIAAADYPDQVYVVDTLSVSLGERAMLYRAMELLKGGLSASEIVKKLNEEKYSLRILAVLDTLEYLKKGGRISAAVAFAGGLLNIKPVITVRDGLVELCGKARGSKNGGNLLRKFIQEDGGVDFSRPYTVAYSGLSDIMLKKYIQDNADLWSTEADSLPICTVGTVIGTHVGPGAIAVCYFMKG